FGPTSSGLARAAGAPGGGDASSTSGNYVSDLGFRSDKNSFSFENYGDEIKATNLTAADLQRMFGDQVCASKQNGQCVLSPTGKSWMNQMNKGMAGGHCEGLAVLSLLMFVGKAKPSDFGANNIGDLDIDGNTKLQREIAYWFATQYT